MRKYLCLGLLLALTACAGDPMAPAAAALKKGDLAGAQSLLEALRDKKPELKEPHYRLFVLYRYFANQADGAKQERLTSAAIAEYSWIMKSVGEGADYVHMEETLKGKDKTRAAYEEAYNAVYSR